LVEWIDNGFFKNMAKIKIRDLGPEKNLRRIFWRGIFSAFAAAIITGGAVWAGSLTPPANPAASGYTLEDIYNRLNTNAAATAGGHSFSPSGDPAGSMYTLTQIYDKIPTVDASKILEGTTYLGVAGAIGIKDSITGTNGELEISLPDGYYEGKTATAGDTDLIAANIKSGINIFGVDGNVNVVDTSGADAAAGDILSGKKAWVEGMEITGTYSPAGYTWTKAGAGSWEGVNENLDWVQGVGDTGWWANQTYSYCGAAACTNNGSLQGTASYIGPPGGWNGSNNSTSFNNSALHNYEVITVNGIDLGGCVADAGDLAFPDGSVWDKSNAKPYSVKLAGCDSNNASSTEIWVAAGGSGPQYAYARNAPSALSIADAWDGKKNLTTGNSGTHSHTNNGKNDDYYDQPAVSWYADIGDGNGASRLPMVEEYERARRGTSDSATSLLYGTGNYWSSFNWSAEQYPNILIYGRNIYPSNGNVSNDSVSGQGERLWVVVRQ